MSRVHSRRYAREAALLTLFQMDFGVDTQHAEDLSELAVDVVPKLKGADLAYAQGLVSGTRAALEEIDAAIAHAAKEWKLERMAGVDRNLIRMAFYEMYYQEERIDSGTAINEAVELAKKYGSDDASRYVNGILSAMQKAAVS